MPKEKEEIYRDVCEVFRAHDVEITECPEKDTIVCVTTVNNLPVALWVAVIGDMIIFSSKVMSVVPNAQRLAVIEKLNRLNTALAWGRFYLTDSVDGDATHGIIVFGYAVKSRGDRSDRDTIEWGLFVALRTVYDWTDDLKAMLDRDCKPPGHMHR